MKKRIFFDASEDLIIFKDAKNDSNYYAMTQDALVEKMKIINNFGKNETDVPDEYKIQVYPMKFHKSKDQYTDIYIPYIQDIIEFPINRIEWILIQIIKN